MNLKINLNLKNIIKMEFTIKDEIRFHLTNYSKEIIDAEDCIQAIDEIVNGTTKPPCI